jgi:hypothetical protein
MNKNILSDAGCAVFCKKPGVLCAGFFKVSGCE